MHPTIPSTLLHVFILVTILSLFHPTFAVLERGVAYLDEYDPDSTESHEWHKRMNGVGVIEVKAERAAPPAVKRSAERDFDWSAPPADGAELTNEHEWTKRGSARDEGKGGDGEGKDEMNKESGWNHKRMERANGAGQGGYVSDPGNAQEGSEWGKRAESGACASCIKRGSNWDGALAKDNDASNDGNDWGKRGEIDWTAPPADDNDSREWEKRIENAGVGASQNGFCATCLFKRITEAIWPPALSKSENNEPRPTKRTPIDPKKNQPCVYAPGADGPTDNVPGGCKPDNWAGPGKREAPIDGPDDSHKDWRMKRSLASDPAESGPFVPRLPNTPFEKSQPFIPPIGKNLSVNKRGLIESWTHPHAMSKRQSPCNNPSWAYCGGTEYCCPTSGLCCTTGACKGNPTDVCCPGFTCPQGYQCDRLCGGCVISGGGCCPDGVRTCGPGQGCCPDGCVPSTSTCCRIGGSCPSGQQCCGDGCAPAENQCCGSGGSCGKGNICVIWQGRSTCCTDLRCTAWISDGVRVELGPTQTEVPEEVQTPPPVTAPPVPPIQTEVEILYSTYYYTITWWYYFYYYTYYAVLDVSTVTSSATTIYTTITITDTASEAASSKFEALSSSIVGEFTTPAEATTALATPTLPANTAAETTEEPAQETTPVSETRPVETPVPLPTQVTTSSRPSRTTAAPIIPTGRSAGKLKNNTLLGWVMGGVAVVAGLGMVL